MRPDRAFLLVTIGIIAMVALSCVILGVAIYTSLPAWLPARAAAAHAPASGAGDVAHPTDTPKPLPSLSARLVVHTPEPTDTLLSPTPLAVAVLASTLAPKPTATPLPPTPPATAVPLLTHTLKPTDTQLVPTSLATAMSLPTATLKTIDAALPTLRPSAATPLPTSTPKPTDTPLSPTATATATPLPPMPTATTAFLPPTAKPTDKPPPTTTASPSPTPGAGQVGQRIIADGIGLTVVSVSKQNEFGPLYLIIDVIIEDVSRNEEVPYAPVDFIVEDSDGFQYYATYWVPYTTLKIGTLAQGSQARGNVAFEIDPAARGFTATYDPTELPGGYQVIRIDLGQ